MGNVWVLRRDRIYGNKISQMSTMNHIHFLIPGNEAREVHTGGLPRLKADAVVIFNPKDSKNVDSLTGVLGEIGIPNRLVPIESSYLDSYRKVSYEAGGAFSRGDCVAINMSSGPDLLRTAMEDAVRIQLYHFLHHTSEEEISASKYFVSREATTKVSVVPIWDFATYLHNNIFELLAAAKEPITLAEMHRSLARTMGRETPRWEAFRKTFREFKRCFKGSPCFVEVVGKGPRYQILT